MKIKCRWHEDNVPSMHVYSNGAFCFVCGKYATPNELKDIDFDTTGEVEPEDLRESFSYINKLPLKPVRGLLLPSDSTSYFVTWPGETYYKRRFFNPKSGKYVGAAGHQRPLFWVRQGSSDTLVIVEGEINALSIGLAVSGVDVVSPGGVGDFSPRNVRKQFTSYYRYSTIVLIADADGPGAKAVIDSMGTLRALGGQRVLWKLMCPDANDVLVHEGKEKLKSEIEAIIIGSTMEEGSSEGDLPI